MIEDRPGKGTKVCQPKPQLFEDNERESRKIGERNLGIWSQRGMTGEMTLRRWKGRRGLSEGVENIARRNFKLGLQKCAGNLKSQKTFRRKPPRKGKLVLVSLSHGHC
jgi:hypothetical protein